MDFRTEQYREQLSMEDKYAKRALALLRSQNAQAGGSAGDAAAGPGSLKFGMTEGIDKPFLYDLVFEKEDTAHTGASKVHRYDRNPGTQTSSALGGVAASLERAANAVTSVVGSTVGKSLDSIGCG